MPHRINIIGTSGSGKTTLAARVAAALNLPHVELDSLHWGPNWTQRPHDAFEQAVRQAVSRDEWVICGNYSRVRPIIWQRATTVVWLDYPKWQVVSRVVARTLRRALLRTELWSGNRERLRTTFLSRESIIMWSITTYDRRRHQYGRMFEEYPVPHARLVRLRSQRQADAWLASLGRSEPRQTPTHPAISGVH